MQHRNAFTLIELLVVIAIIAILSVVVILVLNPGQLLQQSRDANRLSDLSITNTALGVFAAQGGISLGSSSVVYISVPDPSATSSAGDQCQGLNLPSAPSGTTYFCGASSTYRNTNGASWMPVNFSMLAGGSPVGQLPQDPVNATSTGLYYTYATNGSQYIVTALPESQKYKAQYGSTYLVPDYPDVIAQGTNYTISPLWNQSGLVGYWPFEEGSGSSSIDASGNGNGGTWSGTPVGANGTYYGGGKVGSYAGTFDGASTYVNIPNSSSLSPTSITIAEWINWNGPTSAIQGVIAKDVSGGIGNTPYSIYFLANSSLYQFSMTDNSNVSKGGGIATTTAGVWHYLADTYDANSQVMAGYLDGLLIATYMSPGGIGLTTGSLKIGQQKSGFSRFFNGSIDDVRIYNRALSAAEIDALYNAEK